MSWQIRIAALLAVLLALAAAGWRIHVKSDAAGYNRAQAAYTAAIQRQQIEAAATLAAEIEKTRSAEQALATAKNTQDVKDADHKKTVADLSERLRTIAGSAGRLRDPHANACGPGGANPAGDSAAAPHPGAADSTDASGLLSAQLSGLLRNLARDADEINLAYASCRADAYTVRRSPD